MRKVQPHSLYGTQAPSLMTKPAAHWHPSMQLFVSHSEGAARLEQEAGQDVIQGEYVLLALQERAGKRENAHPFSKINSMKLVFFTPEKRREMLHFHQLHLSYHSRAPASRVPARFLRSDRRWRTPHNWHSATPRCHSQHTGQTGSTWSGRGRFSLVTGYLCAACTNLNICTVPHRRWEFEK